jgi:hypothetical protein
MNTDAINLSCTSCGAKLEITDDLERFACSYVNQLSILTPCQRPKMTPQKLKNPVHLTSNSEPANQGSSRFFLQREWAEV